MYSDLDTLDYVSHEENMRIFEGVGLIGFFKLYSIF